MADDLPPEERRRIAREKALASIAEKEREKKECPLSGSSKGHGSVPKDTLKSTKKKGKAHSGKKTSQSSKKSSKNHAVSPKKGGASKYKGHKIVPNSSSPSPSDPTIVRVVSFLARNPEMEFTPKTIAFKIHDEHEAVKKAIQREMKEDFPDIVSPRRGWYRIVLNADRIKALNTVKRFGLHGIQVQAQMSLSGGDASPGTLLVAASDKRYHKQGTSKEFFLGRTVTITVHEMGLIDIALESNKNPLDYEQFNNFCYWIWGKYARVVPDDAWKVINIGINVDMYEHHIRGFESMSLKVFKNAWFQLYQKTEDVVRAEVHMVPDITLRDACQILRGFVTDLELAAQFGSFKPDGPLGESHVGVEDRKPRSKWDFDPAYH